MGRATSPSPSGLPRTDGPIILPVTPEVHMTSVTVRLTDRELKMLKARTGEKDASAAVKAWITRANPRRSTAQLRAAPRQSLKEETAGKGRRFRSGGEAMRWLES